MWSAFAASRVGGRLAMAQRERSRAPEAGRPTRSPGLGELALFGGPLPSPTDDFAALFFIAITFCSALLVMLWFFEHLEQTMKRIEARDRERLRLDDELEPKEPETRR